MVMNKAVKKLRGIFALEWTWRLFLCLQFLGVATLLYYDATRYWSSLPYYRSFYRSFSANLHWDFLNSDYWGKGGENWMMLICLSAPIFVAKALDWICGAQRENSRE